MVEILKLAVAISAINQFSGAFGQATTGLTGITAATAGLAAGLAAAGPAIAIFAAGMSISFIQSSVEAATVFEKEMLRVQAVTQSTGQEFIQLSEFAHHLGATTEWTAEQASKALTSFGMAGFESAELYSAVPVALDLATASMTDMGTTSGIVANIIRAFGMAATEAAHVGDVLTATFTGSYTTIEDLRHTFKMVAPLAEAAGVSFEATAAAIGKLGDAGLKGTLAGTALRQVLTKIIHPTKESLETIHRLNLDIQTFNEIGQESQTVLEGLWPKWRDLNSSIVSTEKDITSLNISFAETSLVMSQNSLVIAQTEAAIASFGNSQTELNTKIASISSAVDIFTGSFGKISEELSLTNLQIDIHETTLGNIQDSYIEWRGNLDALESSLSVLDEGLSNTRDIIKFNNMEITMHQNVVNSAMEGYVEWRGEIDTLESELFSLQTRMRGFTLEQKKNNLELMKVRQQADRVGRELNKQETTRIMYLQAKNSAIGIKQEIESIKKMELEKKIADEKDKVAKENEARLAKIMLSVHDEVSAIEVLQSKNKELQAIETQMSITKYEMMQKIRIEEQAVTAENEKRLAIVQKNSAEEISILEGLMNIQSELSLTHKEANLEMQLSMMQLSELEEQKTAIITAGMDAEISKIAELTASNEELMLQRMIDSVETSKFQLALDLLAQEFGILDDEVNKHAAIVENNVMGTKSFVEILEALEDAGATTADTIVMFGIRGGTGMQSLQKVGSAALKDFTSEVSNSDGELVRVAETIRGSVSVQIDIMKSKWNALKIMFGTELFPTIIMVLDAFKGFMPVISAYIKISTTLFELQYGPILGAIMAVVKALEPLWTWLDKNAEVIGKVTFVALALSMAVVNPLMPLMALVLILGELGFGMDKIKKVFTVFVDVLKLMFMPTINLVIDYFKEVGTALNILYEGILEPIFAFFADLFIPIWESLMGTLIGVDSTIDDLMENELKPLADVIDMVSTVLYEMFSPIKQAESLVLLFGIAVDVLSTYIEVSGFIIGGLIDIIVWIFEPAVTGMINNIRILGLIFTLLWEEVLVPIGNFIGDVLAPIFSFFGSVIDEIGGTITWLNDEIITPFFEFLQDTGETIWEPIQSGIDFVVDSFNSLLEILEPVWDVLSDIVEGFRDAQRLGVLGFAADKLGISTHHTGTGLLGVENDEEIAKLQKGEIVLNRDESDILRGLSNIKGSSSSQSVYQIGEIHIHANSEYEGRAAIKGVMNELKSLKARGVGGGF